MFLGKNIKKMRSISAALGLATAVLVSGATSAIAQKLDDFTGSNRTSFTTLSFTTGGPIRWRVTGNPAAAGANQAFKREFDYGLTDTDSLVVGDYVGDSKSEPTVYRDTTSTFYVGNFPTGAGGITLNRAVPFGNGATDVVATPGDYDGDGKTDYCVIRVINSNLNWYIMSSATGTMRQVVFGTITGATGPSVFPGADFNGDGRDDLVYVTRNSTGTIVNYFIGDAVTGTGIITRSYGNYNNDFSLAPEDYTGDGRADFVAVRQTDGVQSTWYIQNSVTGAVTATKFGLADPAFTDSDLPVRGDFDGDNRFDICVWRPSNQVFYYISSQNNSIQGQQAGNETDTPLGSFAAY